MRSVLSWIVRLYFGIGLVLGVMLFASHTADCGCFTGRLAPTNTWSCARPTR